jgi:hypothetical protein
MDLASRWRLVLVNDSNNARPIVTTLLEGRVIITPTGASKQWKMQGTGTLSGLFSREIFPSGWRPHRDSGQGGNEVFGSRGLISSRGQCGCRTGGVHTRLASSRDIKTQAFLRLVRVWTRRQCMLPLLNNKGKAEDEAKGPSHRPD